MDNQTVQEQAIFEHYSKVEAENYQLKKQLLAQKKEIKNLKHVVRVWKSRAESNHNTNRGSYDERKYRRRKSST
jgi:formate hydrogenlyase subunit 6/NADH:ubiquinone oxidoreductase subunit I